MRPPVVTAHLGIDLGVTNLKWAVVERDDGTWHVLDQGQVPTGSSEGPDAVVARITSTARTAIAARPSIASLGIGVPGRYDPVNGCTRFLVNMPGDWADRPVAGPVGGALGIPASLINDARAFGLAELRLGAGRGAGSIVGVTIGTGIGGVVAVDGRVHLGHDGAAGEIGHQVIDPDGPPCNCGNRGCVEAFAQSDVAACGTADLESAAAAARAGNAAALAGLNALGRHLGIGIANVVTVLTPDRVVIGGGGAAAGDLVLEPLRAELRQRVWMTDLSLLDVRLAELGTWAGAVGAAVHGAERAEAHSR